MRERVPVAELALVTAVGALLVGALAWPAFSGFFIAEDFAHWGSYQEAGESFWGGIFRRHYPVFFRPALKAWGILFHWVLPREPLAYHVRNWLLTAAAIGLLYLVLYRLTSNRLASLAGLSWFVLSKVHLTTIGFVIIGDTVLSLLHSLAALYFLIVYFQDRSRLALALSYLFFGLAVFSRDSGIVLLGVMVAAWAVALLRENTFHWRRLTVKTLPNAVIVAVYLASRFLVLREQIAGADSFYTPSFDAPDVLWRAWVLWGNVWNLSLAEPHVSGVGSYATWLAARFPVFEEWVKPGELVFLALASGLLLVTIVRGWQRDFRLLVPMLWVGLFIGPTLFVRNVQVYYILEPLAGFSMLLATALDGWKPRSAFVLWAVVLVIGGVNSAVQNQQVQVFSWRFCADQAEAVFEPIATKAAEPETKSIVLLCDGPQRTAFWYYTLTGDGTAPMIPFLANKPELAVTIGDKNKLRETLAATSSGEIVFVESAGKFILYAQPGGEPISKPTLAILRLVPSSTPAGSGFNVQPDRRSVVSQFESRSPTISSSDQTWSDTRASIAGVTLSDL